MKDDEYLFLSARMRMYQTLLGEVEHIKDIDSFIREHEDFGDYVDFSLAVTINGESHVWRSSFPASEVMAKLIPIVAELQSEADKV